MVAKLLARQTSNSSLKISENEIKFLPAEIKQKILDELGTLSILRPAYLVILYSFFNDATELTIHKNTYSGAPEITDGDVSKIVGTLTELQKLSLRGSKYLTVPKIQSNKITHVDLMDNGWKCNPIHISCHNLQVLRINTSPALIYRTLSNASICSPLLKVLDLSRSTKLTAFQLGEPSPSHFPHLEELILHACSNLEKLSIKSTSLRILDLSGCRFLSDTIIQENLRTIPKLEQLDLRDCKLQILLPKVYYCQFENVN